MHKRRRRHQPTAAEAMVVVIFLLLVFILGFILIAGLLSGKNRLSYAQIYAQQTLQALNAEATPTPFQPVDNNQAVSNLGAPQSQSGRELVYQKPEGQINVLLLGSDARLDTGGFRTDTIIWVSLNPKDGFVSAVSFPRDLFVDIPGMSSNRINVVFPRGGLDLLADTMALNFGVRPDYFVYIDFQGFTSIIDNLGGITVQAAQGHTDTCIRSLSATGMCSVGPGPVHMNGDLALWYARSRYSTNDIDRGRRAQEVVEAIFVRLMSLDAILKAPELYNAYTQYVQTDITLSEIVPLLPFANTIYTERDTRNYVIGFDYVYNWVTPQGAQVLVPNKELIRELMIEALNLNITN